MSTRSGSRIKFVRPFHAFLTLPGTHSITYILTLKAAILAEEQPTVIANAEDMVLNTFLAPGATHHVCVPRTGPGPGPSISIL